MHLRLLWEFIRCVNELLFYRTIDATCIPQPHSAIQRAKREIIELAGSRDPSLGDDAIEGSQPEPGPTDELGSDIGIRAIQAGFDHENQLALMRYRKQVSANRNSWSDTEMRAASDECRSAMRRLEEARFKAIVECLFDDL